MDELDRARDAIAQLASVRSQTEGGLEVRLVTHMELPDGAPWSETGFYLRLRDGTYRKVCGLTEI